MRVAIDGSVAICAARTAITVIVWCDEASRAKAIGNRHAIGHRLGVRPRARMQLSNAADLPPAPARAAWRSHSMPSVRKEFVVGALLLGVGGGAY